MALYAPRFSLEIVGEDTVLTWKLFDPDDYDAPPITGSAIVGSYSDAWLNEYTVIADGALIPIASWSESVGVSNHLVRVNVFTGSVVTLLTIIDTEDVGQMFKVSASETGDRILVEIVVEEENTSNVVSSLDGGETWRFGELGGTGGYHRVTMLGDGTLVAIRPGGDGSVSDPGFYYSHDGGSTWVGYEVGYYDAPRPMLAGGFVPVTRFPALVWMLTEEEETVSQLYYFEINPTPTLSPHPSGVFDVWFTTVYSTSFGLFVRIRDGYWGDAVYSKLWTPTGEVSVLEEPFTYTSPAGNMLYVNDWEYPSTFIAGGGPVVTEFWTTKRACTEVV